eukprot:6742686-Prymnesium_polylepis.1
MALLSNSLDLRLPLTTACDVEAATFLRSLLPDAHALRTSLFDATGAAALRAPVDCVLADLKRAH